VQWLTAGRGISHSEMFPLVERDRPNPVELFQIWLNLPARDKLVEPHFTMLWDREIPRIRAEGIEVTVIAGRLGDAVPPPPPPGSWAARPDSDVAIWSIRLAPGARWLIPPAQPGTLRTLYLFKGTAEVAGRALAASVGIKLRGDAEVLLAATGEAELLLLQGKPIGEPVVAYGPFVMTSRAEIQQAFADYQRTHFGGWPWPSDDPVHPRDEARFARHADGRIEHA
jgi:redox-sensitive bicupin YhaK (pirin superfamily)